MHIYEKTNLFLEDCFRTLEDSIPYPVPVELGGKMTFRYEHHGPQVAILQKLARYISGLNATLILLRTGYTQELGALFRTLDEFGEDINFLALPLVSDHESTEIHKKYLEYFFKEEFENPNNALLSPQNRPTIPRKKIHAELAKSPLLGINPSDCQEVFRTISQTYGGYVHGASVHILDLVGGMPPKYHLQGMRNTPRYGEFAYNYWDYSYRGIIATNIAGKALGSAEVDSKTKDYIEHFEEVTGDTGKGDPEKFVQEAKRKGA